MSCIFTRHSPSNFIAAVIPRLSTTSDSIAFRADRDVRALWHCVGIGLPRCRILFITHGRKHAASPITLCTTCVICTAQRHETCTTGASWRPSAEDQCGSLGAQVTSSSAQPATAVPWISAHSTRSLFSRCTIRCIIQHDGMSFRSGPHHGASWSERSVNPCLIYQGRSGIDP